TTCCSTPPPCCPSTPAVPGAPAAPAYPTPGVGEQRSLPPAGVGETREGAPTTGKGYDAYKPSPPPPLPPTSFNRQLAPQLPAAPKAPPAVRLERIVSLPGPGVEGQVIRSDKEPLGGAKVMFVNADRQGDQQSVTADSQGQFRADLTAGHWLVYLHKTDGSLDFQNKIEVRAEETQRLTLLGR